MNSDRGVALAPAATSLALVVIGLMGGVLVGSAVAAWISESSR